MKRFLVGVLVALAAIGVAFPQGMGPGPGVKSYASATPLPGLMMLSTTTALQSNKNFNVCGTDGFPTGVTNTQMEVQETVTFSKLSAKIISGNSGTATFSFRDGASAGQQTFNIAGTGTGTDSTNSDVLTAGDLFAGLYTDTGTDSTIAWITMLADFGTTAGNFHCASNFTGAIYDAASSTRYLSFAGPLIADGITTEDDTEWRNRGYTSLETFHVFVTANARTNDSIFRSRVNGGNGGLTVTIGAGVTGRIEATGTADTLASGDTVNASITLDTGVEDLTIAYIMGVFKSSTGKTEIFSGTGNGLTRAASTTANYLQLGGRATAFQATEADAAATVGFATQVSHLRCYLSANTYTGTGASEGTIKLFVNNVHATGMTAAITASGGAGWYENAVNTVTIDDNDTLSIEIDEGSSGSITIRHCGVTFNPV